jgi:hypothetical protein
MSETPSGPIIRKLSGPRRVSLDAKSVTIRVTVRPFSGPRYFSASIFSAGRVFISSRDNGLPSWVGHRAGTFSVTLPIASGNGHKLAVKLRPLAAEYTVGFLDKFHDGVEESAVRFFTLT